MKLQKRRPLQEAAEQSGIDLEALLHFIDWQWIHPVDHSHQILDEEDIARARLIWQLQHDFGVNQEAIPIILHLIDQLNCLHIELKIEAENKKDKI
jgi:chaperone modulatory protein CbpM